MGASTPPKSTAFQGGPLPLRAALFGLFLSGVAGLIDEVCWVRRSSFVFGSTTHALTTVLMVFFLGLALGGFWFGRLAGRMRRPLRTCAWLEIALALLVLVTPLAFDFVDRIYGGIVRALPPDSPWLLLARGGLVSVILLPPAFLMGGTQPLFARQFVRDPHGIGRSIAWIYALNTLGAAVGALLAGFLLLPLIGLRGSLAAAAVLNVLAALVLLFTRAGAIEPAKAEAARAPVRRGVRLVVAALLFATGFVALGEEVLWARFLAPLVGNSVHTYSLLLALVLIGIVIGSALVARASDRMRSRALVFGVLQVVSGLLVWLLLKLPPSWWRSLGGELATASVLLLPPAVLSGASFPLAVRMVVGTPAWAGIGLGSMIAVNTVGGILGSILVGFFLLPYVGIEGALRVCTGLSLVAGFVAWIALAREDSPVSRGTRVTTVAMAVAAILAWLAIPAVFPTRVPADFLADRASLVAYREGFEANLAVVRRDTGVLVLEIDRWWQGQDRKTHQVMAAHLPMMLHTKPKRVLLVGVGAGQTPERFTMHPIERLDCVDIEPRVFELVRANFANGWMADPRVRLLPLDGRNYLMHTAGRYDVISLEVGQLFRPGVASFYTLDFYRRARERLAPGGILAQFVPLPFLSPDELRGTIATFLEVFPEATLWYNTSELLLIGSGGAPLRLRQERVAEVLADPKIAHDLEWSLWGGPDRWLSRPEVVYGSFLCGPRGLAALARGGILYRDDRPVLDYAVSRPKDHERREITTLPLLRAQLEPFEAVEPGLPDAVVQTASRVREENLAEVIAAAYLRDVDGARERGDITGATEALRQALAAQPGNLKANRLMGDAMLLSRRFDEAERYYRQALAISDRDPQVHAALGLVCLVQERFAEAATYYRVAIALGEDHAEWRNNLGAALGRLGDLPGALEQFERALVLEPGLADAHRNAEQTRAAIQAGLPGAPDSGAAGSRP